MTKETPANDEVSWTVKLEKERFASLQRAELPIARRQPEIHFVRFLCGEVGEPIEICYGDVDVHDFSEAL